MSARRWAEVIQGQSEIRSISRFSTGLSGDGRIQFCPDSSSRSPLVESAAEGSPCDYRSRTNLTVKILEFVRLGGTLERDVAIDYGFEGR